MTGTMQSRRNSPTMANSVIARLSRSLIGKPRRVMTKSVDMRGVESYSTGHVNHSPVYDAEIDCPENGERPIDIR